VLSRLGMPVTGDPFTELDDDLRRLAAERRACAVRGEAAMAARLARVIDDRLEQRHAFTTAAFAPGIEL
jgi:hypothetical protein